MDILGIIVLLGLMMTAVQSFKFNQTCQGNLKISCGDKPIILISVMIVTRQNWACSLAGSGDRNNRKEENVWRKCSGKSSCTIKSGMKLEDYKYMGIHYDCGRSYDMCSSVNIKGNKAYLASPNYRNVFPYADSTICRCKALLSEPTRIVVGVQYKQFSSIDTHLMIRWRPEEVVQIYEETDLSPGVIFRKTANETFVVMFNANGRKGTGFFQLFYKASVPITLACNMEIPTLRPTTTLGTTTTTLLLPPASTQASSVMTTAPLETHTTTETPTTQPAITVVTEPVETTTVLTTTTSPAMTTATTPSTELIIVLKTMAPPTTTVLEPPIKFTVTPTTIEDDQIYQNLTEIPVVGSVIQTDQEGKVLGVLIPALIGTSVLVAVTCLVSLLVLILLGRSKRKRRNTNKSHVVSRSVYELEHPVPGKEESDQIGNGNIEDSAAPSLDLDNENLKRSRNESDSIGRKSLSGKSVDSDKKHVKDIGSIESIVMIDNVLYEELDEVAEVTPGSPTLYATMDNGRKMWNGPPERKSDAIVPVTLEQGPSLARNEGHGLTLKSENVELAEQDGPTLVITNNSQKQVDEKCSDLVNGNSQKDAVQADEDSEIDACESTRLLARESDNDSDIPEYACVKKKPKQTPSEKAPLCSDEDNLSENSCLIFDGNRNEPDYEEVNCRNDNDLHPKKDIDAECQPCLPSGGADDDNHGAYMSVDVTKLWPEENGSRHNIYEEV